MNQTNRMTSLFFDRNNWHKVKALGSSIVISLVALVGLFYLIGDSPERLLAATDQNITPPYFEDNLDKQGIWSMVTEERTHQQNNGRIKDLGEKINTTSI